MNETIKTIISACEDAGVKCLMVSVYNSSFVFKIMYGEDEYQFDLPYHCIDNIPHVLFEALQKQPVI